MTRRALPALVLTAATGLVLASCASADASSGDASDSGDGISIVASTSVYADLAKSIVGDAAEVTAIIDSPTVDPHSYEATARDQLTVTEADLVIFNGGGYDYYMEQLVDSGEVAHSVMAVEHSHDFPGADGHDHDHSDDDHADADHADDAHADEDHGDDDHADDEHADHDHGHDDEHGHDHDHADDHDHDHDHDHADDDHADDDHADDHDRADDHDHAEDEHDHDHAGDDHDGHHHVDGFNEHVWYDLHTIVHVVEAIVEEVGELLPDDAETFTQNGAELISELEGLEGELHGIEENHGGATVFFTEPVGGYMTAAAGLDDVTPDGFAEAVEHGQDVAPATLLAAITAIEGGDVDVVIVNPQTAGPETEQVLDTARDADVPVIEYTETLPEGETFATWMQGNIEALGSALTS